MVQFKILSGKKAGTVWVSRRFPFRVGRSAEADLQTDEPGVWDQHFRVEMRRREGFVLKPEGQAITAVNAARIEKEQLLRNGDTVELGALKLQFWLAETRQRGLALREWLIWIALAAITFSQIALIYFVLN
jgi:predicted component of type VI protein secretion system